MSLFNFILRLRVREPEILTVKTDGAAVLITSRMLGCSEFELFRIAHNQWFGAQISDRAAEEVFKPYVFTGEVPFWVRYFCNSVRDREASGTLDIDALCASSVPRVSEQINTLIA